MSSIKQKRSGPPALLRVLVIIGFAVLLWTNRADLPTAVRSIRHARGAWLVVGFFGSTAMIINLAGLHRSTQSMVGIERHWRTSIALAYGVYFFNQIAKSGGMAGAGLIVSEAKREGKSSGAATAGYVIATILNQLGFSIALIVGLVIAAHQNRLTQVDWIAALVFALLTIAFLASLVAAARSQKATRRIFAIPSKLLQFVARLLHRSERLSSPRVSTSAALQESHQRADDFFKTIQTLKKGPCRVALPLCHALLAEVIGVGILCATLASLGVSQGLALPIAGYTVSILFSIVGFLPGGLGVVEISLASALISIGLTVGKAAAAVAIFRIFELWLPVGIGAVFAGHFRKTSSFR